MCIKNLSLANILKHEASCQILRIIKLHENTYHQASQEYVSSKLIFIKLIYRFMKLIYLCSCQLDKSNFDAKSINNSELSFIFQAIDGNYYRKSTEMEKEQSCGTEGKQFYVSNLVKIMKGVVMVFCSSWHRSCNAVK